MAGEGDDGHRGEWGDPWDLSRPAPRGGVGQWAGQTRTGFPATRPPLTQPLAEPLGQPLAPPLAQPQPLGQPQPFSGEAYLGRPTGISAYAIASFTLSLVGMPLTSITIGSGNTFLAAMAIAWVGSVLAIPLGARAHREIGIAGGVLGGAPIATAGLIIGVIGFALYSIFWTDFAVTYHQADGLAHTVRTFGAASDAKMTVHQPSFATLEQLAPGGIDRSASVGPASQAPLLCGGVKPSRLVEATVVGLPGNLSQISVTEFGFPSSGAAKSYLTADSHPFVGVDPCKVPVPDDGIFEPSSYLAIDHGMYGATAYTSYDSGTYEGTAVWSEIDYIPQGADVYVVRVDEINGGVDPNFMDAVLNSMAAPNGPQLSYGAHSLHPGVVAGTLESAPYGEWSAVYQSAGAAYFNCPELVIGRTPYTIVFENQLSDPQASGLVVRSAAGPTTIPWGSHVNAVVDTLADSSSEETFYCRIPSRATTVFANVVGMSRSR